MIELFPDEGCSSPYSLNHIEQEDGCTHVWSNDCFQGPWEHTIAGGYDVLLSARWQPWPSLGRGENFHLGHVSVMPGNSFQTESPAACGSYPLFLSAQQDLLLHP
jgi:hypothetical protein